MGYTFLSVNKEYFGTGLQPIDILILSQVEEYNRNNRDCYLTNQQFADMFGATLYAVKNSLDKLENLKYIERDTSFIEGRGRANRRRIIKMVGRSSTYQNSNDDKNDNGRLTINPPNDNGRLNSEQWKVDSRPIKENKNKNNKNKKGDASIPSVASDAQETLMKDDELFRKLSEYSKCSVEEIKSHVPEISDDMDKLLWFFETHGDHVDRECFEKSPYNGSYDDYWEYLKKEFDFYC